MSPWLLSSSVWAACGLPPNRPQFGNWCYVDGVHVRVWWDNQVFPEYRAMAAVALDEADKTIWPKFLALLGREPRSDGDKKAYPFNGGDGRLDIVLTQKHGDDIYGVTLPETAKDEESPPVFYVIVQPTDNQKILKGTLAHELMHAFINAFTVGVACEDCAWLSEATATWAEDFVYHDSQTEWEYADRFFGEPQESLNYDPPLAKSRHRYGAYLFIFYLSHINSPSVVRAIWQSIATSPNSLTAIDNALREQGLGGFEELWPKFIAANWNREPAVYTRGGETGTRGFYQLWDDLDKGVSQQQKAYRDIGLKLDANGQQEFPMTVELPKLSSQYFRFTFDSPDIRSVRLIHNLDHLDKNKTKGATLTVFTKVKDKWKMENDWTHGREDGGACKGARDQHCWCGSRPAERLQEMIVIFGNFDISSQDPLTFVGSAPMMQGLPGLTVTNMPCDKAKLKIKLHTEFHNQAPGFQELEADLTLKFRESTLCGTTNSDGECNTGQFQILKVTSSSYKVRQDAPSCHFTASGEVPFSPNTDPPPFGLPLIYAGPYETTDGPRARFFVGSIGFPEFLVKAKSLINTHFCGTQDYPYFPESLQLLVDTAFSGTGRIDRNSTQGPPASYTSTWEWSVEPVDDQDVSIPVAVLKRNFYGSGNARDLSGCTLCGQRELAALE